MQIQRSFVENESAGRFYLVPTPIGNLADMTYRGVETLRQSDLVLAEDTRQTIKLLQHYDLNLPLETYHAHSSEARVEDLVSRLKAGAVMSLVSDAGMPIINDPGSRLVARLIEEDIPVIALPGANAALTSLIASGLRADQFTYYGFFPRSAKDQQAVLSLVAQREGTAIFYESPYRVKACLAKISECLGGETSVVLARELTKMYEEYQRGTVAELYDQVNQVPVKGECVVLVEGGQQRDLPIEPMSDLLVKDQVQALIDSQGLKPNAAIKSVAKNLGLPRQDVYRDYHGLDE